MGFGKIKMDMFGNRSRALIIVLIFATGQAFGAQLYYSPVTVNSGQVPSTQTDFPMLVSYTDARFKTTGNGGHVNNSNGYDIRPYSDTALTTALTYQLERYNASTGEVIMWVKIASLADSSVVYLGYGDSSLSTDGSSTSTWDSNFTGVYHVKDGTTLDVTSGTGSNNGTNHSATATTGKVDGGASFVSASSQYIDVGANQASVSALTISAWINGTSFPNSYNAVAGWASATPRNGIILVKSTGKLAMFVFATTQRSYDGTGSNTLSTGTTYHVALTYNSSAGLVGYVNGASDATQSANGNIQSSGTLSYIGNDPGTAGRFWNGMIDEIRFSNVARAGSWITTEYNNMNAPSTFATLGTEVSIATSQRGWFIFFPQR